MSSKSQTPSKGPPPLPMLARHEAPDAPFAAPLRDVADDVEEAFFLEGTDGHAESLPSEPEAATIALPSVDAQPLESREAEHADVEDPARTRRRRAARIGVVWGACLMVGAAGAGAFMSPHGQERAPVALSTSAAPVEVEDVAPAAAPIAATALPPLQASPEPELAAAVTPPRPVVRAMTASTKTAGATHPRAVAQRKSAAPSRGAKASPASPKASRASQARTAATRSTRSTRSTRVAASKPPAATSKVGSTKTHPA